MKLIEELAFVPSDKREAFMEKRFDVEFRKFSFDCVVDLSSEFALFAVSELAKEISQTLEQEIKKKGEATFLVSGGSTPKKLYEILSNTEIDWNNVSIGLIDERFVATDTDESNELLIKNTLLKNQALFLVFY